MIFDFLKWARYYYNVNIGKFNHSTSPLVNLLLEKKGNFQKK